MKMVQKFFLSTVACLLLFPAVSLAGMDEMVSDAVSKIQPTLAKISDDMKVVAVYSITGDKEGRVNVESLQDRVVGVLLKSEKFQVIDRANLKRLLEEQALSMTGVVDEAQMVKAGKLIGVKGFFFGTVDVNDESVVLTLKLVSVETSAIVWSKEFVGEAASAAKLGIGAGVISSNFGMDAAFKSINQDLTLGQFTRLAGEDGIENSGITFANLLVSYRQGIKGFRIGQVGCDLAFSYFIGEQGIKFKQPDRTDSFNSSTNRWGGYAGYEAMRLGLRPKLFLSMKNLLGWESDWMAPYVGASVDYYIMKMSYEIHRTQTAPTFKAFDQEESTGMSQIILVSPLLGVEVSPAKSLTVFAEVIYMLGGEGDVKSSKPKMAELMVDVTPRVEAGVTFQAGVKYNFTLGGSSGK